MICHQRRFIFIHIRKTGGTSLEAALVDGEAAYTKKYRPGKEPVAQTLLPMENRKHNILRDFNSNVVEEYFTFSIVRNPWDRAVSRYFWERKLGRPSACLFATFKDYIMARRGRASLEWNVTNDNSEVYRSQFDSLQIDGKIGVDKVWRFEDLKKCYPEIAKKLGIHFEKLPHVFKSKHEPYWTYYNNYTKEIVTEAYRDDIEHFGYHFERVD